MTTVLKPEDHLLEGAERVVARLASAGRPVVSYVDPYYDELDRDVGIGEVGEIIGRSEAMMKGYWNLPKETEEKLKGGWLRTGDLGRFDEDGYVYVVERKNDMIISGGVNIYPREIEEVLPAPGDPGSHCYRCAGRILGRVREGRHSAQGRRDRYRG